MPYQKNCLPQFIENHVPIILWSIPIISVLLHWHVFNLDLVGIHVWRQTQTQNVINNFYREDMNILRPRINACAETTRILRLEFPAMQWLFACFYKVFGSHIIISRMLSFAMGLGTVYGMFYFCNNAFRNRAIAAICAWCFNFSPLFYYYTLNPMPDNMALCCGIWSISLFCTHINTGEMKYAYWSAALLCLATLAKLPFIIYGSFMLSYVITQFGRKELTPKKVLTICSAFFILMQPAVFWYVAVMPSWKPNAVLTGLFDPGIKISTLLYILWGNLISVLPELLINYGSVLFFLVSCFLVFSSGVIKKKYFPVFAAWGTTIVAYFLFEMNAIAFVHDYYLMPFLPPIFLLVSLGAYQLLISNNRFANILSVVCLLILPLTAFLRADSRWDTKDPGFPVAFYDFKQELRNLVPSTAYCIVGNDCSDQILLYYIDRKGWTYSNDELDGNLLSYYIKNGAAYLFASGNTDTKPCVKVHLAEKIFDKESLRVYKLK